MRPITFARVSAAASVIRGETITSGWDGPKPRRPSRKDFWDAVELFWAAGLLEGLGPGEREGAAVDISLLPLEELRSRYEAAQAAGLGHQGEGLGL
jgi:hypothetical protein